MIGINKKMVEVNVFSLYLCMAGCIESTLFPFAFLFISFITSKSSQIYPKVIKKTPLIKKKILSSEFFITISINGLSIQTFHFSLHTFAQILHYGAHHQAFP